VYKTENGGKRFSRYECLCLVTGALLCYLPESLVCPLSMKWILLLTISVINLLVYLSFSRRFYLKWLPVQYGCIHCQTISIDDMWWNADL